ncbi:hypothetical protein C8N44_111158 [Allosediminivita pacifica]|uniref:Uncharacterized protein n=2 Tax=Allosediminivita pacifica TaxID=1267769 RepID=A0A2T6AVK6_9RHOB|nr:hypothetical protein [Allosediminivita pacifica]PTX47827.1 hypothetical protein C8N44_111158 [Allosediminivita pacifica]
MSDPGTNLETEKRRHRPALTGIAVVLGFVAIITAVYSVMVVERAPGPDGAEEQVEVGPGGDPEE